MSFACVFLFRGVSSTEFPLLENRCKNIIKEKQAFERLEVKKEILLDMFKVSLWSSCDSGTVIFRNATFIR